MGDRRAVRGAERGALQPRRRARRVGAALGVAASVVVLTGVALAGWTTPGAGSGYAKAQRVIPLTTEPATTTADLYPGSTGDLMVTIRNDNDFPVTATALEPNGPVTSDSATCDADGSGVTFTPTTGEFLVRAHESATHTLPDAVAMSESAAASCEGATFTIPVRIVGQVGAFGGNPSTSTSTSTTSSTTSTTAAGAAQLVIAPNVYNFGSVPLGQPSTPASFTVTNTGTATTAEAPAVSVTSPPVPAPSRAPQYTIGGSTCTQPLAPQAACTVEVTFTPYSSGSFSASLRADVSGSTGSASLNGTGRSDAVLRLSPNPVNFGNVVLGSFPGAAATVTLENTGTTISDPINTAISGTNATDFAITSNPCPSSLAPGGSCAIQLRFTPQASGTRTAVLTAFSGPTTATASLAGVGQRPAALTMTPSSWSAGTVPVGQMGPSATFTVRNTGDATSGSITVARGGAAVADFTITSNTCGAALPGNGACTIVVRFDPQAPGTRSATLTASANPGGAATSSLTGTGA